MSPKSVIVVGGGIAGLGVARGLVRRGIAVTVVERGTVGGGATWGSAGWICPAQAGPLSEPAALRYGLRSVFDRTSALYVDPRRLPGMVPWLLRFARAATAQRHAAGVRTLAAFGKRAFSLVDELAAEGAAFRTYKQGVVVAAAREQPLRDFLDSIAPVRARGPDRAARRRRAARARAGALSRVAIRRLARGELARRLRRARGRDRRAPPPGRRRDRGTHERARDHGPRRANRCGHARGGRGRPRRRSMVAGAPPLAGAGRQGLQLHRPSEVDAAPRDPVRRVARRLLSVLRPAARGGDDGVQRSLLARERAPGRVAQGPNTVADRLGRKLRERDVGRAQAGRAGRDAGRRPLAGEREPLRRGPATRCSGSRSGSYSERRWPT